MQYLASHYRTYSSGSLKSLVINDDKFLYDPFHKVLTDSYSATKGQELEQERIREAKRLKREHELARRRAEERRALEAERQRQENVAVARANKNEELKGMLVAGAVLVGGIYLLGKAFGKLGGSDSGYSSSSIGNDYGGSSAASSQPTSKSSRVGIQATP